jgi:hypothetical protein
MANHRSFWTATVGAAVILGTVLALVALGAITAHAHGHRGVVLGSKHFTSTSKGFGTMKPHSFSNGGDASGFVYDIHWHHWGRPSARGRGLNPIFKPHGGYYRQPGHIQLKAFRIGRCPGSNRRAYTRLSVRVSRTPNAPIHGHWHSWAPSGNICKYI